MQKRTAQLLVGPVIFLLAVLVIPSSIFDFTARVAFGTVLWMGAWWITTPVSVAVTGMIPVVINAIFCVIPMNLLTKAKILLKPTVAPAEQ